MKGRIELVIRRNSIQGRKIHCTFNESAEKDRGEQDTSGQEAEGIAPRLTKESEKNR